MIGQHPLARRTSKLLFGSRYMQVVADAKHWYRSRRDSVPEPTTLPATQRDRPTPLLTGIFSHASKAPTANNNNHNIQLLTTRRIPLNNHEGHAAASATFQTITYMQMQGSWILKAGASHVLSPSGTGDQGQPGTCQASKATCI